MSGLSLIQFGPGPPANSRDTDLSTYHALEAQVGNCHVFRIHARNGITLGNGFGYRNQYHDSHIDRSVYSGVVDGARKFGA